MKLISWNIDSLNAALTSDSDRAKLSKEVLHQIAAQQADVIAIQETKLSAKGPSKIHLENIYEIFPDYQVVWRSSEEPARKGYAGTMFLYHQSYTPIVTFPQIDAPTTMDAEGRIITLEFPAFYLTQVYTPNAGSNLDRLSDRQIWDQKYAQYLASLDQDKPVIATGDYNVAHQEIDLANPARNHFSAGFTDEERAGFSNLLAQGFTDTYRHLNGPEAVEYTWWNQRVRTSKINNSGWRIDYWLVSDRLTDQLVQSVMLDSGVRQDHTPILLEISL